MQHNDAGATPRHSNRLIHETSPYLLQHAHNPVDWYPWGEEAFARARAEDKPILLSVGYSACHWCHVMAHESFENEETAALMNAHFVNIKVDREERPDVDALYMDAVQALTGRGGWPMTVFLTPDGAPFYGGTYFPPEDRFGMPGFATLLERMAEVYRTKRAEVEQQAQAFREFYRQRSQGRLASTLGAGLQGGEPDASVLDAAATRLLGQMDSKHGGFGQAPKFPHSMALDFLLRMESRRRPGTPGDDGRLIRPVRLTLDKMAAGGMYDQVGGGFHRYSTDERWLVPHFEKMLYDNALLARTYVAGWQVMGDPAYRRIAVETLEYVLREMTLPEGGFAATQDADSEGEEGKFYVWSPAELRAAVGEGDYSIAERVWGVSERGNFEGHNILHVARASADVAQDLGTTEEEVRAAIGRARQRLYAVRAERVWPGRDDKVITDWNALMLRALAEAGRSLERTDFIQAAEQNAGFLLDHLRADGKLLRTWRGGRAKLDGYLEDYAALANGLLTLYEATGNLHWYMSAQELGEAMLRRFWDDLTGSFFDTAHDHEQLIGRPRELSDGATPSGTSLACEALLRLYAFTGDEQYRAPTERVLTPLSSALAEQPSAFGQLLCVLDDFVGPMQEIAIVGHGDDPATRALVECVNAHYLPRTVCAQRAPDDAAAAALPLLAERTLVNAQPAAYVCERFVCQRPVTDPAELANLLDAAGRTLGTSLS
jgi:uncharacterized protein YyaL (SSP411 family)